MTRQQFTDNFFPMAVEAAKGTPIFPETIISAAGLESGWNTSQLSMEYNNFFGFKSSSSWKGRVVSLPTKEEINGKVVTVQAIFRVYDSPVDSFKDYVRLLQTTRYVNAGVTTAKDSIEQFQALQRAGYATDSSYASKLSSVYYSIKSFFKKTPK
jgi:flagellum-specific peptidoglycan hydrolase FlgJ